MCVAKTVCGADLQAVAARAAVQDGVVLPGDPRPVHDPEQVQLCRKVLRGALHNPQILMFATRALIVDKISIFCLLKPYPKTSMFNVLPL